MNPLAVFEDRAMVVPPGHVVQTSYVPVEKVRLACRDRMAVGDVERSMQRLLAVQPAQPWPCPVGEWEDDYRTFVVHDGRHAYVAALMLGYSHLLVAWVERLEPRAWDA